jgi:hypothetical protein
MKNKKVLTIAILIILAIIAIIIINTIRNSPLKLEVESTAEIPNVKYSYPSNWTEGTNEAGQIFYDLKDKKEYTSFVISYKDHGEKGLLGIKPEALRDEFRGTLESGGRYKITSATIENIGDHEYGILEYHDIQGRQNGYMGDTIGYYIVYITKQGNYSYIYYLCRSNLKPTKKEINTVKSILKNMKYE